MGLSPPTDIDSFKKKGWGGKAAPPQKTSPKSLNSASVDSQGYTATRMYMAVTMALYICNLHPNMFSPSTYIVYQDKT